MNLTSFTEILSPVVSVCTGCAVVVVIEAHAKVCITLGEDVRAVTGAVHPRRHYLLRSFLPCRDVLAAFAPFDTLFVKRRAEFPPVGTFVTVAHQTLPCADCCCFCQAFHFFEFGKPRVDALYVHKLKDLVCKFDLPRRLRTLIILSDDIVRRRGLSISGACRTA